MVRSHSILGTFTHSLEAKFFLQPTILPTVSCLCQAAGHGASLLSMRQAWAPCKDDLLRPELIQALGARRA